MAEQKIDVLRLDTDFIFDMVYRARRFL